MLNMTRKERIKDWFMVKVLRLHRVRELTDVKLDSFSFLPGGRIGPCFYYSGYKYKYVRGIPIKDLNVNIDGIEIARFSDEDHNKSNATHSTKKVEDEKIK